MNCDLPEAQLWSWIDREAPELEGHLADCPACRERAARIREDIRLIGADMTEDLPLPDRVGSYLVKDLLGEGGQALVYEAEQESPKRNIALKVLRGGRFAGEKRVKHFLRETLTLARLSHPAIATIFEAGRTEDGLHFFAMELVQGRPLNSYVNDEGLDRDARLELFIRICRAVQYAHENGVVHRDLKPSNILVTDEGDPKVLDFGLAHMTQTATELAISLTRTGMMAGTPRYMSPEQIRGHRSEIGPATDVYSLGVILYEMLTGQPPYEAASFTPESVISICDEEPVRPSRLDASLQGDLETIVLKALAKDASDRFASTADLAADLQRFRERKPIRARRPSFLSGVSRFLGHHRLAAGLTTIALALAIYAAWHFTRPPFDHLVARQNLLALRTQYFLESPANRMNPHYAMMAPERYPGLPEGVLLKAMALAAEEEGGIAIRYLTGELALDPDQWLYRALISSVGVGRDTTLDTSFARWVASRLPGTEADSWYLRTFTTLDPEEAFEYAQAALSHQPDHLLALEMCARLASMTGDLAEGVVAMSRLLEIGDPRHQLWLTQRSVLLCRLGRPEEALADIDQLIEEYPRAAPQYMARAQIHRWLGQYDLAVADCTEAIRIEEARQEPSGWLHYHRGTPLLISGRLEEAVADYRLAYELLARITYGNVRLVVALYDLGLMVEAEEAMAEIRRRGTTDAWLQAIVDCLDGRISPEGLVALADPGRLQHVCEGYYYAGEVHRLQGRPDEALTMYREAVAVGQTIDQGNYKDRLSEHELAQWRLRSWEADRGVFRVR